MKNESYFCEIPQVLVSCFRKHGLCKNLWIFVSNILQVVVG